MHTQQMLTQCVHNDAHTTDAAFMSSRETRAMSPPSHAMTRVEICGPFSV